MFALVSLALIVKKLGETGSKSRMLEKTVRIGQDLLLEKKVQKHAEPRFWL